MIRLAPLRAGGADADADADDPWEASVRARLKLLEFILADEGWYATHDVYVGYLNEGEIRDVSITRDAGVFYSIVGVCDDDCTDLDLALYDPSGEMIDLDLPADDYPEVSVTPSGSGAYRFRVLMSDCEIGPCRFGVQAFTHENP